jgi:malonate-semialdehyde dehydrogenase (acetylating)/methylmalonate-semialdehyde dehydrogenase
MTAKLQHFMGGKATDGSSGRWGEVFDPARGSVAKMVPLASKSEVDAAITAAQAAWPGWAAHPPLARARIMARLVQLVQRDADRLAALITEEHGKVLSDAKGELTRGLEVVEFAAGIPHLLKGDYSDQVGRGVDSPWAWWPASRHSIFPPWYRCGCSRWRSPAAIVSS